MCPAIAKTSDDEIVAAARAVVAARGVDNLSLSDVASTVGIKTPSLYKRFADRAALVDAVRDDALRELATRMAATPASRDPVRRLLGLARAYRRFGQDEPELYRLVMASGGEPSPAALAAIAPVLDALSAIVAKESILPAARCLTAFLHGFVSMEINGNFQMGGSIDRAFEFGLETILKGLAA